jgi:hypothetical protein
MEYYGEVYSKILEGIDGKINVFDFGCGINGFSYEEFSKAGFNVNYIGTEPVGQLCKLQNAWFEKRKMTALVEHISLFDLEANKEMVQSTKYKVQGKSVGFFFKVLDSLEMMKRNYSKEVLKEIVPLFERCVISWATRSLVSKKKFHAERTWLKNFIEENFKIIEEFDAGVEHYLVFSKK